LSHVAERVVEITRMTLGFMNRPRLLQFLLPALRVCYVIKLRAAPAHPSPLSFPRISVCSPCTKEPPAGGQREGGAGFPNPIPSLADTKTQLQPRRLSRTCIHRKQPPRIRPNAPRRRKPVPGKLSSRIFTLFATRLPALAVGLPLQLHARTRGREIALLLGDFEVPSSRQNLHSSTAPAILMPTRTVCIVGVLPCLGASPRRSRANV